jgi:hypothetical protein
VTVREFITQQQWVISGVTLFVDHHRIRTSTIKESIQKAEILKSIERRYRSTIGKSLMGAAIILQ